MVQAGTCGLRATALRPVPERTAGQVTVATQNLRRLLDDVDDGAPAVEAVPTDAYRRHLDKLALQVVDVLHEPDVLAVQEAENADVLQVLAQAVATRTRHAPYRVLLSGRGGYGGINSGFLVRADARILTVEAVLARRRLDGAALFDRPPLHVRVQLSPDRILDVVNVHLKSLRGSDDSAEAAARIARKRTRQAAVLAEWVRDFLTGNPQAALALLGDFNATTDGLGGVDVLGPLAAAGLTLMDERLPVEERYTYVHACRGLALDHVLVSPALLPAVGALAVSRGNAGSSFRHAARPDSPLHSSDHDALVLYLRP